MLIEDLVIVSHTIPVAAKRKRLPWSFQDHSKAEHKEFSWKIQLVKAYPDSEIKRQKQPENKDEETRKGTDMRW